MKWDERRGPREPTVYIKRLISLFGLRVDLHKIVQPDDDYCYHTHPANAIRIILWGGYVEERHDGVYKYWWSGKFGNVSPSFCHRIHRLLKGPSYSLWLRGRVTAEVKLIGAGWKILCLSCTEIEGKDVFRTPEQTVIKDGQKHCGFCGHNLEGALALALYGERKTTREF